MVYLLVFIGGMCLGALFVAFLRDLDRLGRKD